MPASPKVTVLIDLARIRANAAEIRGRVGVPIIAVVKADAYGLGIEQVTAALSDLVEGWCVFSFAEAARARLAERTGRTSLALGPGDGENADEYLAQRVRPAVWDVDRAAALRAANPILSVDTGMQRFACPPAQIDAVLKAGGCTEAFTHALDLTGVRLLQERAGNRGLKLHAAGTSLLDEPSARLDAVRPGLALYLGAARVSTRLVEARNATGPAGYSRFAGARHGVILAGYSNGIRKGPCQINGRRSRILEVGMQSSFIELEPADRAGDEVILLGEGVAESDVAASWQTSPHEVLTRLCAAGERRWVTLS